MHSRRTFLAGLGTVALAGCASNDGTQGKSTPGRSGTPTGSPGSAEPDIHVLTDYNSEQWQREWNQIVSGFEQQSGLTVSVDYPPRYHPRLRELSRQNDLPEVFTGTAPEVANYIAADRTQPVGDLVTSLTDANGPLLAGHSVRGPDATHLVPHGLSMMVLNYRADIYEKLGLSVPETWAELLDNTRVIAESDRVEASGFAVPATGLDDVKTRTDFLTWLYSAGGGLWQWADGSERTVELDLATEDVHAALQQMRTLSQYSPDPTEMGSTGILSEWINGELAQCLFPNAALAGFSYDRQHPGAATVARQTRQAPVPLRDTALSPPTRGRAWLEGTPMFRGTNADATRRFLRYMYRGPAAQAARNGTTPRLLPPYEGVIDAEEYRNADIYQVEDGHFWELERTLMADVAPFYRGERPRTPAAWYAMGPPEGGPSPLTVLVRSVVLDDRSFEEATAEARQRLQARLDEGRALS